MKAIWKYQLEITDRQVISMPEDARILDIQCQQGHVTLWALVTPGNGRHDRTFLIFGTGNPIDDTIMVDKYIGTVQQGQFVWHVFEEIF